MYAALWRALPGRRWLKSVESLLLFLAVVALLFLWIFPAITPFLPFEHVTVESPSAVPTTPITGATSR